LFSNTVALRIASPLLPGHTEGRPQLAPAFPDSDEQHTLDHLDCPACQAANLALCAEDDGFAEMRFRDAAERWIWLRRQDPGLKPRTLEFVRTALNAMNRFFGSLRLCDITPGHLRGYQIARVKNQLRMGQTLTSPWQHPAGHSCVNHELCVLAMMLKHAKRWHILRPFYFPLPVASWSPREILSEPDEERLFRILEKHPEAQLAYWVAAITNNTTASGCELRGLRLENLFLREKGQISEIYIPPDAVKNSSRPRKIALNPTARWAIEQCYKRALKLGSCEPGHFLFPLRIKRNEYDPTQRASRSWLRKSWDKLRKATGFQELQPHDLRHHAITRLLENGVEENTVIAIAGHVGKKMLEYYAHHRTRVKYAAVMAIDGQRQPGVRSPVRALPASSGMLSRNPKGE
jgi:integrase